MRRFVQDWFPSILLGLYWIGEIMLNLPNPPSLFGIPGAAWISILLLVIQIILLQRRILELENTKPNIVVSGVDEVNEETIDYSYIPQKGKYGKIKSVLPITPNTTSGSWLDIQKEASNITNYRIKIESVGGLEFFRVGFRNEEIKGKSIKDADDVHARVEVWNKERTRLIYSHEKPEWQFHKPKDVVKISTSLKPKYLYLAFRKKGSNKLYIFNSDSLTDNRESYRSIEENFEFKDSKYYICVKLGFDGRFHDYGIPLKILETGEPHFKIASSISQKTK